jgi:hypothetical protein
MPEEQELISKQLIESLRDDSRNREVTEEKVEITKRLYRRIDWFAFQSLPQLRFLIIKHCNLNKIDPGVFRNLPHLRQVDLSHNLIASADNHLFEDMPNVRIIDLSFNQIGKVYSKTFRSLPKLKKLNLSHNSISSVEKKAFQNLKNHEHPIDINLSNNKIWVSEELASEINRKLHADSSVNLTNNVSDEEELRAEKIKTQLLEEEKARAKETKQPEVAICPFAYRGDIKKELPGQEFPRKFEYYKSPNWEYDTGTNLFGGHECSLHPRKGTIVVDAEGPPIVEVKKKTMVCVTCQKPKHRVEFDEPTVRPASEHCY